MTSLFFYGTLCDPELLEIVLGRKADGISQASLPNHQVYWAKEEPFPMIVSEDGATAYGVLVKDVTPEELGRLDFYEGGFDYKTVVLNTHSAGTDTQALVFFPVAGSWEVGPKWDLADWQTKWGRVVRRGAHEVMSYQGKVAPSDIVEMYPAILSRAHSRLNASTTSKPSTINANDVQIDAHRTPYAGFFNVEEYDLRFPKFQGGHSETVKRAVFRMADAVTVLPYDPAREKILLIEQFRIGPMARGDHACWIYEPIAGRVDPAESYELTAKREAREEARLEVKQLHEISRSYPSPGSVTEFLVSFLAICDLTDDLLGVAGLESEAEDIRSHIFDLNEVLEMADSGLIRVTPLLASLYWLDRNRGKFA
jgi:ADP-ribose pyrophosphatase